MYNLDDPDDIEPGFDRQDAVKFLANTLKAVQKQVDELDHIDDPNLEEVRRGIAMAWIGATRYAVELSKSRGQQRFRERITAEAATPLHA